MPTDEFSFALRPSPLDGIGVFAVHGIKQDAVLRLFTADDTRDLFIEIPATFQKHVVADNPTMCPADFGRMSVGWYLNHSDQPNATHSNYVYRALRDIAADEEVTIDYHLSL